MNNNRYKLIDQFNGTYWSGLSGSMFIGPYFVDEINQFSYTLTENTVPAYSYNSFTPIFMPGARIIQGEFGINYKNDSYIFTLLEKIRRTTVPAGVPPAVSTSGGDAARNTYTVPKEQELLSYKVGYGKPSNQGFLEEQLNPELLLNSSEEGRAAMLKSYAKAKQEDRMLKGNYMSGMAYEEEKFKYTPSRYSPALYAPINITLRFGYNIGEGIVLKLNETGRWSESIHSSSSELFNIGTGCVLINAVLTSRSVRITDSGVPTVELYSFMAQDIRPLNKVLESTSNNERKASSIPSAKKIEIS